MNVKIKRIDKSLPLPQYETQGAVAFDFIAREDTVIEPNGIGRVPTNTIVEIPKGYMILIRDRSGTAKKKGVLMTAGVIDQDYCGDNDEILMQFYNPSDIPITIERGERVAQGMFIAVGIGEWEEVDKMDKEDRGGFGSTDKKSDEKQEEQKMSMDAIQPKVSRKGKLIVIDGIDGTGKATQAARLLKRLQQEGYDVASSDFPQYGEKSAGLVENYLNGKYGQVEDVSSYVASFFYMLDRYDASFQMRKWMNQGKIILSNRYVSANMGHQGSKFDTLQKRREFFKWDDYYEYTLFNIPRPDLTIILHIPAEEAQKLVDQKESREYLNTGTRDIIEGNLDHLKRAEQTYLEMCEEFHDFELIECMENGRLLSVEEISELVWAKASKII